MFWVISVQFNIRNTLPKSRTFLLGHPVYVCSLQEIRWPGKGTLVKNNYTILNRGRKSDTHEFGRGFYFTIHIMDNLSDFKIVNDRICKIKLKLNITP